MPGQREGIPSRRLTRAIQQSAKGIILAPSPLRIRLKTHGSTFSLTNHVAFPLPFSELELSFSLTLPLTLLVLLLNDLPLLSLQGSFRLRWRHWRPRSIGKGLSCRLLWQRDALLSLLTFTLTFSLAIKAKGLRWCAKRWSCGRHSLRNWSVLWLRLLLHSNRLLASVAYCWVRRGLGNKYPIGGIPLGS